MNRDLLISAVQYRNLFILFLLLGLPLGLMGQILDDTTKLVYGPKTTTFIREGSLYYQTKQEYYPDTLIRNFYRILPLERSGYRLQTLENTGTAQSPVFYTLPEQIGLRSGFYVYDNWFNEPAEIRYYNTRSPFTRLFATFGGDGRSWLDITHARNINPRWSVGLDFTRLTAEQQIAPSPQANLRNQVTSTAYALYTRYESENGRYALLANLSRLKHTVKESGGILFTGEDLPADLGNLIEYEDSPRRLEDARSSVLRLNYHLFHQYKLVNALQLYHIFDRETRTDSYLDAAPNAAYYNLDAFPAEVQALGEDFFSREYKNQLGVKGGYKAGHWNAYAKHRSVKLAPTPELIEQVDELAVGGYLALQPDSLRTLRLEAELRNEGQYRFEALAQNTWLSLRYQRSQYKPAYLYQYRNTLFNEWNNESFLDPTADRLEGTFFLKLGSLVFKPGLQLTLVQNPLYFRADTLTGIGRPVDIAPVQGSTAQMISPRLAFSLKISDRVFWEGDAQYTYVTEKSAEAFPVPSWLFNSALYYEGPLFGGNLLGQFGVDVHMKAAYFAQAYDPVLRQFVVQDDFLVPAYPVANLFFGFKINTTRVFARLSHFNQGLTGQGYFTTPYYNGLERTFDFGIDWLFFD